MGMRDATSGQDQASAKQRTLALAGVPLRQQCEVPYGRRLELTHRPPTAILLQYILADMLEHPIKSIEPLLAVDRFAYARYTWHWRWEEQFDSHSDVVFYMYPDAPEVNAALNAFQRGRRGADYTQDFSLWRAQMTSYAQRVAAPLGEIGATRREIEFIALWMMDVISQKRCLVQSQSVDALAREMNRIFL